jgi:hypothetical protein
MLTRAATLRDQQSIKSTNRFVKVEPDFVVKILIFVISFHSQLAIPPSTPLIIKVRGSFFLHTNAAPGKCPKPYSSHGITKKQENQDSSMLWLPGIHDPSKEEKKQRNRMQETPPNM